mgnify:CR=1
MAVEERNGSSGGKCAERNLAGCGADSIFHELLALESGKVTHLGMGEFFAFVKYFNLAHLVWFILFINFADVIRFLFDSAKLQL